MQYLARFCHSTKKNRWYWDAWKTQTDPAAFSRFTRAFLRDFAEQIAAADCICAVPFSGLGLATLAALRFAKPLIVIDFEHGALREGATAIEAESVLLIDTCVNTGGTVLSALSILEACLGCRSRIAVGVFNDTISRLQRQAPISALLQSGRLRYISRLSDILKHPRA